MTSFFMPRESSIPVGSSASLACAGVSCSSGKCSDWKYPVATHADMNALRGTDSQARRVRSAKEVRVYTLLRTGCPLVPMGNVS